MPDRRLRRFGPFAAISVLSLILALLPAAAGANDTLDIGDQVDDPDEISVVTLVIPDQSTLAAMVDRGIDLDHNLEMVDGGYTVTGIVTNAQAAELKALGVGVDTDMTPAELAAHQGAAATDREEAAASRMTMSSALEDTDTVVIARADYFTSTNDSQFLSVEAKTSDGTSPASANPTMTLRWDAGPGTEIGDGGQVNMSAFVDAGQYMYHRTQQNLASAPPTLTVDAPSSAAGNYSGPQASFGPSFDESFPSTQLALVDAGGDNPTQGCATLIGFPAGAIAVADRGGCPFVEIVGNAQAAGASAVVVANNVSGSPIAMGGSDSSITIPSLMVSLDDGNTIKAGLPATGSISQPAPAVPTRVSVTSANGGYAEADVSEWLPTDFPSRNNRYFDGFLEHYPDAYEFDAMLDELHEDFPELTEIIELPFLTNGYRRHAMTVFGDSNANRIGVTSNDWGHEGGNDITVAMIDPDGDDSDLSVDVDGDTITISLATDDEGAITSTSADVVGAINGDDDAADLVHAYTYRGNAGSGVVSADSRQLTDGLNAPEHVLRAPFQVRAIRIGKVRDGSKTGVLGYSVEHAREWQTPLVSMESAYRLLHNYHTDTDTRRLVDNLDIFIVPVVNPDGHLYSYYDFASQRKNMTNYCPIDGSYDYNARNSWGVDNNRNYTAYSSADGYSGGSTSCTSGTYRGPDELSEPESANIHWLPGAYPNIKFSMNIHSSGNYYMWSPGSYATPGRISAPRPSFGEENYFWYMADRILTEIKQQRGLSVAPARTGPIADVLYSAAGNSGDMMWYDFAIFGFSFEVGTSFQPSFAGGAGSEAWQQMMEFSNGLVELFEVALTWTRDRYAPTSWINEDVSEPADGPVGITFGTSEPADIYYTTDGSNPTTDSAKYDFAGIREGGETLWFEETTTIKWFSVDMAGNVEGKYDPRRDNANSATITIGD